MPGRLKQFIAIGISIMAMACFNTYHITQIDLEITALKCKTDFLMDKITDVIKKKFQSPMHHHENMVKLAHHNITIWHLVHLMKF